MNQTCTFSIPSADRKSLNEYAFILGKLRNETESLFNYTGGNDTFEAHNPINTTAPPFLEDLVAAQRNNSNFDSRRNACTIDNVLSRPCLYDFMVTDNANVAMETMRSEEVSGEIMVSAGWRVSLWQRHAVTSKKFGLGNLFFSFYLKL